MIFIFSYLFQCFSVSLLRNHLAALKQVSDCTGLVTYIHWIFSWFSDIVLHPQKVRNHKAYYYTVAVRDGEPRTATSTFTQLLSSDIQQTGPATLIFNFVSCSYSYRLVLILSLMWYCDFHLLVLISVFLCFFIVWPTSPFCIYIYYFVNYYIHVEDATAWQDTF